MADDTAGDPVTGVKWTRRTTEKIADALGEHGIDVCPNTVAKLLKQLGYTLRVNHKKLTRRPSPDRDEQFAYIAATRKRFTTAEQPIISVDTKHRELVGNFAHKGTTWRQTPRLVNDHDFPSDAIGVAIPYGVYDLQANHGTVFVGTSHDTAHFAVANIAKWWTWHGRHRYPNATELLILADSGGSNGNRTRAWKHQLQQRLCDTHGLTVTVCHYPVSASKWDPIEHRLFSEISKNWAGQPLDSYETVLNYIKTTTTTTGLKVNAHVTHTDYPTGIQTSHEAMDALACHVAGDRLALSRSPVENHAQQDPSLL